MSHPLPGAGHLISESWALFTKTWSTTVKYSAWFILAGVHSLVFTFLFPFATNALSVSLFVISFLVLMVVLFWAAIRLYQSILAVNAGHEVTKKTTEDAPKLILPLLLVAILEYFAVFSALLLPFLILVIVAAIRMGGGLATEAFFGSVLPLMWIILPFLLLTIYLGVRFCFSQLALVADNRRGRAALVESWNLTKGRFWPILWREIAMGLLFTLLMLVIVVVVGLIIGLTVGVTSSTGNALTSLASSFIQAALMPFACIYQVKLFRSLEKRG